MFSHAFQGGGLGVEIFSSAGKDPAKLWKCTRNVHRVYDRTVKGFVFLLEKGTATQMSIPPEPSREALGLVQPVLVLQLRLSPSKHTSLELIVLDDGGNRRRMHLSSTFREFECNDLHIQIPLRFETEDRWVNLVLDLDAIIRSCYRGLKFQSILYICLKPVCRLRKVFTLFQSDRRAPIAIPAMYEFPAGTSHTNIFIPEDSAPGGARTPSVQELSLPPPPSGSAASQPPTAEPPKRDKAFEDTECAVAPLVAAPPQSPSDVEKASRALKLLKRPRVGNHSDTAEVDLGADTNGDGATFISNNSDGTAHGIYAAMEIPLHGTNTTKEYTTAAEGNTAAEVFRHREDVANPNLTSAEESSSPADVLGATSSTLAASTHSLAPGPPSAADAGEESLVRVRLAVTADLFPSGSETAPYPQSATRPSTAVSTPRTPLLREVPANYTPKATPAEESFKSHSPSPAATKVAIPTPPTVRDPQEEACGGPTAVVQVFPGEISSSTPQAHPIVHSVELAIAPAASRQDYHDTGIVRIPAEGVSRRPVGLSPMQMRLTDIELKKLEDEYIQEYGREALLALNMR